MVITWNSGFFLATWKPHKKLTWLVIAPMNLSDSRRFIWLFPLYVVNLDPERDVTCPSAASSKRSGPAVALDAHPAARVLLPLWSGPGARPGQPVLTVPNGMLYVDGMNVSPEVIYIIRHAKKPLKPPLCGVDFEGVQNEHSLLPRGWQRSGALAALFHPDFGPMRAGLRTPTVLVAPSWGHPGKTAAHRSYQTIQGLSEQLGLPVASEFAQGQEQQLADDLVRSHSGVVLICWEHSHI